MSTYYYRVAQGKATLSKGDDVKLVTIGKYNTDIEAKDACIKHYNKAIKACINLNKPVPQMFFI